MQWLAEAREQAHAREQPRYFSVQMQLLHECNLVCAHCYDAQHPTLRMPDTLEVSRWLDNVFAFGRAIGVRPDIHLSGGEPTVRRDLVRIVAEIFQKHQGDALLFTNGTRWTADLASSLHAQGLRWVQVSLEGPRAQTDSVRGPGVFDQAMATLNTLANQGFSLTISVTVTRANVSVLPAFVAEMDGLGVHFHLREVFGIGNGQNVLGLTPTQRREFYDWAINYEGECTVGIEDPIHCSVAPAFAKTQTGCAAGRNHFCVDVDGSVHPCRPLRRKVGDVNDLASAWNHPDMQRFRHRDLGGDCGRCTLRWHCGGCRVHAATQGDVFGQDSRCFARQSDVLLDPASGRLLLAAERLARRARRLTDRWERR